MRLPQLTQNYLMMALEGNPTILRELVSGHLDDQASWDAKPDPERFSAREALAHIAEYEDIFLHRMRQTATEERPGLLPRDPGQLAIDHDYAHADLAECLQRYEEGRKKLLAYLKSLSGDEVWLRVGIHAVYGPLTLENQATQVALHDAYHFKQIAEYLS